MAEFHKQSRVSSAQVPATNTSSLYRNAESYSGCCELGQPPKCQKLDGSSSDDTTAIQIESSGAVRTDPSHSDTTCTPDRDTWSNGASSPSNTTITSPSLAKANDGLPLVSKSKANSFLLDLPREIREQIFSYVVPIHSRVAPTFAQGMLLHGIQGPVYHDENVATCANIDASLMRVNKNLNDEIATLVYGSNRYNFNDAATCYWWLKRIGSVNINKIHSLVISLYSGFLRSPRSVFVRSEEEIWANVFEYLRNKHNFTSLRVTISCWTDLKDPSNRAESYIPDDRIAEVNEARAKAVQNLGKLRGLPDITIRQRGCSYLAPAHLHKLQLLMQQPKTRTPLPQSTIPLGELLNVVRHWRMDKEIERKRQLIKSFRRPTYGKRHTRQT